MAIIRQGYFAQKLHVSQAIQNILLKRMQRFKFIFSSYSLNDAWNTNPSFIARDLWQLRLVIENPESKIWDSSIHANSFKLEQLVDFTFLNAPYLYAATICSGVYKAKIKEIHQKIKHETNCQSAIMMLPMKAKKRKLEEEVVWKYETSSPTTAFNCYYCNCLNVLICTSCT